MKSLDDALLYAFVDTTYLDGRSPGLIARQLCDGGADIVQLRAKDLQREAVRAMALEILPVTRAAGVPLVINDDWEMACELGAEVAHLGQEDFFDAGHGHRRELPVVRSDGHVKPPALGLSTHGPEQAARALKAEPDYIAVGPVFPTATKPGAPAVTLDYVRWAAAHVAIPWFAIGGIDLKNLDRVLEAGARRVCVVSAILRAPDIVEACQAFRRRLA